MKEQIFKPSCNLTFETVESDNLRFQKLLRNNKGVTNIIINLADVNHCDSTGLALLIEAKRLCNKKNIKCKMINASESLSGLSKFCGVDETLL